MRIKRLLPISVVLLFVGCLTQKKLAKRCQEDFPCTPSVTVVTKDSVRRDTIREATQPIPASTLYLCPKSDKDSLHLVSVPCNCPPAEKIVETRTVEKTTTIRDSSAIFLANERALKAEKKAERLENWLYFIIGVVATLLIVGVIFAILWFKLGKAK